MHDHAVWLGLGTNTGDRADNLARCIAALPPHVHVEALSSVYETEPFGFRDQPVFWNMAVRGRTSLSPAALLASLKELEAGLGRVKTFHMGPRAIDIDILLFDDVVMKESALEIPHSGLIIRPFVLQPLLELDGSLVHPATGERLAELAAARDEQGIRRVGAAAQVLAGKGAGQ